MADDYAAFLATKAPLAIQRGIEPEAMPDCLLPHAKACVEYLLRCGSGGLFLDTGLTKTRCQLEWSRQAAQASNGYALILTPLAVARQFEREGRANGYDVRVIREQADAKPGINVCNYDRLDKLNPAAFGSVSLDESSILKHSMGKQANQITGLFSQHRFRLSASATPAPNDHAELGMHAQFCGVMSYQEMLSTFFKNDTGSASQKWRLKRHGVEAFWNWMASWCRMAQMPSDLGFSDEGFILPALHVHSTETEAAPIKGDDLFGGGTISATDMHKIKRQTAEARARVAVDYAMAMPSEPCVIWCDTDYEADAIKAAFGDAPGIAEIRGSHKIEKKEAALDGFLDGSIRVLVTKSSVTGYGLNWQHCNRTAFVGRTFSYEAWYQAIRRFWRFGQLRPVDCLVVVAEGEEQIGRVLKRKGDDHAQMKTAMTLAMHRATATETRRMVAYNPTTITRLPQWIKSAA